MKPDEVDRRFDFSDEEPTVPDHTTMAVLMESMMDDESQTIMLSISDRPTRPIRPMVYAKEKSDG